MIRSPAGPRILIGMTPSSRRTTGCAVATFLFVAGCMSPEEYRLDADEEVYALIHARRRELVEGGAFSIDPPPHALRERILAGEWDPTNELSLADCLEIAAENSREYQDRRERLYLTALDLTLERWQFANRPFASLRGSVAGIGDEAETAAVAGDAGFTRVLGSGAEIVASLGADLFRIVSTGDGWDAFTNLGLSFTQPLLRGAGERIVLEPLTQAERDLVYEVRAFERFRRTFALDVARAVYDLLRSVDEITNEEQNYRELLKLRERNQAMAEAGRLSRIQADQAYQDELRSEARLLVLRAQLERQRDEFNLFLGLPVQAELRLDPAEFERLESEDDVLQRLDERGAIQYALAARLDFMTTLDQLVDSERSVDIAADALRAGLTLSGDVAAVSEEGRVGRFELDEVVWATSLSLDLPLDRKAERNAYRRSLIALEAAQRTVEEEGDLIQADVRNALRIAVNAAKDYTIQEGAVELAQRRVESAQLNLDAGRADTRDVLEAREALVEAENALTTALVAFTLARLDLYLQLELLRVDDTGLRIEAELAPTAVMTEDSTDRAGNSDGGNSDGGDPDGDDGG